LSQYVAPGFLHCQTYRLLRHQRQQNPYRKSRSLQQVDRSPVHSKGYSQQNGKKPPRDPN
jgi:hypothetical protein